MKIFVKQEILCSSILTAVTCRQIGIIIGNSIKPIITKKKKSCARLPRRHSPSPKLPATVHIIIVIVVYQHFAESKLLCLSPAWLTSLWWFNFNIITIGQGFPFNKLLQCLMVADLYLSLFFLSLLPQPLSGELVNFAAAALFHHCVLDLCNMGWTTSLTSPSDGCCRAGIFFDVR